MTKQKALRRLGVLVGVAGLITVSPVPTPFSRCMVEEVRSPSQVGSAILVTEQGVQGGPLTVLFIRDYAKSGSKALKLATEDNADFPLDAVWSKDGTLLAYGPGTRFYVYDFSQHREIYSEVKSGASQSQLVTDLLARHGGDGPAFEGRTHLRKWWEQFDLNASYLDFDG